MLSNESRCAPPDPEQMEVDPQVVVLTGVVIAAGHAWLQVGPLFAEHNLRRFTRCTMSQLQRSLRAGGWVQLAAGAQLMTMGPGFVLQGIGAMALGVWTTRSWRWMSWPPIKTDWEVPAEVDDYVSRMERWLESGGQGLMPR